MEYFKNSLEQTKVTRFYIIKNSGKQQEIGLSISEETFEIQVILFVMQIILCWIFPVRFKLYLVSKWNLQ